MRSPLTFLLIGDIALRLAKRYASGTLRERTFADKARIAYNRC